MRRPSADLDLLARRALATPDRLALVDSETGEESTYRELDRAVDAVSAALGRGSAVDSGTDGRSINGDSSRSEALAGDPIATLLPTGGPFVRVAFAAFRTGSTLVPLGPNESTATLVMACEAVRPSTLVCAASTADLALAVADRAPVDHVVSIEPVSSAPIASLGGGDPANAPPPTPIDGNDVALVCFTSGTGGRPKGVKLTTDNLLASARRSAYRLGVEPDDRWLDPLGVHHMGGFAPIVRSTQYGTTVVTQPEFTAKGTIATLESQDATLVSLVPTMVKRMLDRGWEPSEKLRVALVGGAPTPPALVEDALDAGVPLYPTFGTTETSSQVATATPAQSARHPGIVGHPLFEVDVTVVDDDGVSLPAGETGRIRVCGPTVSAGYLDDRNGAGTFENGCVLTGDRGVLDHEGLLWITGREADRIVTGGETVDSNVVRSVLTGLPAVESAFVVGVTDEEWGERVGAIVVPSDPDAPPSVASIDDHCRDRLATHERPRTVAIVDTLPRTVSGTVDRDAVRSILDDCIEGSETSSQDDDRS